MKKGKRRFAVVKTKPDDPPKKTVRQCIVCETPQPDDMEENFKKSTVLTAQGINPAPVPPTVFKFHDDTGAIIKEKAICANCCMVIFQKFQSLMAAGVLKMVRVDDVANSPGGLVEPS